MWAENKSRRTVLSYREAGRFLRQFLVAEGMPTDAASIRREHVESFIIDLLGRWKPATVSNRYRALQQFFKWALEEGEIRTFPMANYVTRESQLRSHRMVRQGPNTALSALTHGLHRDFVPPPP